MDTHCCASSGPPTVTFKGLLSLGNVPLIEFTTNPHLQFDILYSCTVNPMKLSLIPYIDLTEPLPGEIQRCSVMGTSVCIYWMWIYSICGMVVGHVGLGFCGFGCMPLRRLHSGKQPPLSSASIHKFSAARTLSAKPNGA